MPIKKLIGKIVKNIIIFKYIEHIFEKMASILLT